LLPYFECYLEIAAVFIQRFLAEPWLGNTSLYNWGLLFTCIKPTINLWESGVIVSRIVNSKCLEDPQFLRLRVRFWTVAFAFSDYIWSLVRLTCVSVSIRLVATSNRLGLDKYLFCLNCFSSSSSCWLVKAVRGLLVFPRRACWGPQPATKTLMLILYFVIYFPLNFVSQSLIALYKYSVTSEQPVVDIRNYRYPHLRNWG